MDGGDIMSIPSSAKDIVRDVVDALSWRKLWEEKFKVSMNDSYYQGQQKRPNIIRDTDDYYITNLIFSTIRSMVPSLFPRDPWFSVNAEKRGMEEREKISEATLNFYLIKRQSIKKLVRSIILDAFIAYGVGKVIFERETEKNPQAGEVLLGDDGRPLVDPTGQVIVEPKQLPSSERFLLIRIPWSDFVVNPECGNELTEVEGHRWSAQRIIRPLEEVKKDVRYSKKARENLQPANKKTLETVSRKFFRKAGEGASRELITNFGEHKLPWEPVILWEIHYAEEQKIVTVSQDFDEDVLLSEDYPEGIDRSPFAVLKFAEIPDQFYPIPEISQWRDPQDEYNVQRTMRNAMRRRMARILLRDKQKVDDEEVDKLMNPIDGTVIDVKQPGQAGVQGAIAEMNQNRLDPGVFADFGAIRQDFAEVSGRSSESRGSPQAKFATQSLIIQQGVKDREIDMQDSIGELLNNLGMITLRLLGENLTIPQAIRITGPRGVFWQEDITSEQLLSGEFWLDVEIGVKGSLSPEIKTRRLIEALSVLAKFPALAISPAMMEVLFESMGIKDRKMIDEIVSLAFMFTGIQGGQGGNGAGPPGAPPSGDGGGEGELANLQSAALASEN